MTTKTRIKTLVSLTVLALMLIVQSAAAKKIPAQLPDPDNTPPAKNKPVKVYILAGQSNMVGIGQVSGGSSRWGKQFIDPVVSIYPGAYSPTADYDKMTPAETKKLTSFGGTTPTPYPKGGTAVTRGFIKLKSDGVYEFNAGYGASMDNIMEIDGKPIPPKMLIAAGKRGAVIVENGKVTKTFKTRKSCQDAWMLENGDVIATEQIGLTRFDKDGKVLMRYTVTEGKKRELHSCQPLPKSGILVAESAPPRLIELGKTGIVTREIPVTEIKLANKHLQMRGARKNKKGEYAIISSGEMRLIVLNPDGTTKSTVDLRKLPKKIKHRFSHAVAFLDNGNILVSTSYGSCFVELDPKGKVVWSLTPEDLPELKLKYASGMQRLKNGNTICTAYNGLFPIFEVTPGKKIVWKIAASKELGTPLHVQVINKKQKPSNFKINK
ncbi:MAG: hypothetical protein FVQ82_11250 [Planctomycetes bacterium]|nr:hypothetical protein [Planctomycetota bacterium]